MKRFLVMILCSLSLCGDFDLMRLQYELAQLGGGAREASTALQSGAPSQALQALDPAVAALVDVINEIENYNQWENQKKVEHNILHFLSLFFGFNSEQAFLQAKSSEKISSADLTVLQQAFINMRVRVAKSLWADIKETAEEPKSKERAKKYKNKKPVTLENAYQELINWREKAKDKEWAETQALNWNESDLRYSWSAVMSRLSSRFLYGIDQLNTRFIRIFDIRFAAKRETERALFYTYNFGEFDALWKSILEPILKEFNNVAKMIYNMWLNIINAAASKHQAEALCAFIRDNSGLGGNGTMEWILYTMKKQRSSFHDGGVALSEELYKDWAPKLKQLHEQLGKQCNYKKTTLPDQAPQKEQPPPQKKPVTTGQESVTIIPEQDKQNIEKFVGEFFKKIQQDRIVPLMSSDGSEVLDEYSVEKLSAQNINEAGKQLNKELVDKLKSYKKLQNFKDNVLPENVIVDWGRFIGKLINRNISKDIVRKVRLLIRGQMHSDSLKKHHLITAYTDADIGQVVDEAFKYITIPSS
jgi:hypothetical protein